MIINKSHTMLQFPGNPGPISCTRTERSHPLPGSVAASRGSTCGSGWSRRALSDTSSRSAWRPTTPGYIPQPILRGECDLAAADGPWLLSNLVKHPIWEQPGNIWQHMGPVPHLSQWYNPNPETLHTRLNWGQTFYSSSAKLGSSSKLIYIYSRLVFRGDQKPQAR